MTLDIGAAALALPFIAAHQAQKPAVRLAVASLCCIGIGVFTYLGGLRSLRLLRPASQSRKRTKQRRAADTA